MMNLVIMLNYYHKIVCIMIIKLKKVGNHWYPCIPHLQGQNIFFCRNAERYFNLISKPKIIDPEELTLELEEIGVEIYGINNIYFYEEDITRYLTTDDYFDLRMEINGYTFIINSDFYFLLEDLYQLNFHYTSYKIHIY